MAQPRGSSFPVERSEESVKQKRLSSVPMRIFAVCLTSVVTAVHYTNYGPLIPVIQADLHISSGQAGLLSTFLFLGLAVMYIPAGILIDRYGARPVLICSSLLLVVGGVLLPVFPNLLWILACRAIIGFGTGGAFVSGASIAASLGKYTALGQGLYGGSIQIGSGCGLLVTPLLLAHFGWRGAFLVWGSLGGLALIVWLFVNDGQETHGEERGDVRAGVRSPSVWTLGLSHMGTFGVGNAIAAWIAVYLAHQYGLPLALAATLGSLPLLTGVLFRPLGGFLLGRKLLGAIPLLRMGTIMDGLGLILLALPWRLPIFAIVGLALIAVGATMPYTSVFNEAAHLRRVGKGVAQGLVSIISCPAVILGPPIIGFLFGQTNSFSPAFGAMLFFSIIAITASLFAGPAVKRETTW